MRHLAMENIDQPHGRAFADPDDAQGGGMDEADGDVGVLLAQGDGRQEAGAAAAENQNGANHGVLRRTRASAVGRFPSNAAGL
jgi:hypothetical protein